MNPVELDTALNGGGGFIKYAEVRDLVGNRVTARLIDNNTYEVIRATLWQFIIQLYGDAN